LTEGKTEVKIMRARAKSRVVGQLLGVAAMMALLCGSADAAQPGMASGKDRSEIAAGTASPAKALKPRARANPASFTPEMPFGEAIDILRRSTRPPLNIVVLWREIGDNAGVYRDTPIGIDGVKGLRLGQYLDLLLLSVSAGASARLGYTVEKGMVVIGTTDTLPVKRVTRVYDVSDLVAEPARYFFPMMGFGAMGLGGMFGGMPMMGSYGAGMGMGYGGGAGFMSGGAYGPGRGQGLSGLVNHLYGGTERRSGTYRRR